ncbi:50S ribosomal protein L18-like isoform X1 [Telopea speciosissima]|uniref:50S ribosomal protein L18-like isoform X1 n=2 Tax=Telopea speciosissima TaxID=54955 RepID=UPI001CC66072|nr:50S ribosomal protein L18-like isoform X1 [Telopea speciosissima]
MLLLCSSRPNPWQRPKIANLVRWFCSSSEPGAKMVILPPVRPPQITKFLKPYVLKMHFTNKFVSAQVIHSPTATVASSASSQEKSLRSSMENTRDVAAAAKIGKLLGERLLLKGIPAISVFLKREQKYHGKVKAVIDSVREAGVKLI